MKKDNIEKIVKASFSDGNLVRILHGGRETFELIINEIERAEKFLTLQFYIFRNDDTGKKIANLLKKKAGEGIKVYVLYDHFGSFGTPRGFWKELINAGIKVAASRPFKLSAPLKYVRRDHRKLIIIDGRKAFTGGLNIANEYSGFHLRRKEPWRDTGILIEGPAVYQLFEEFRRAWRLWAGESIENFSGPLFSFKEGYPVIPIFASSFRGSRRFRKLLYYCIKNSKRFIYITTAYFVPGLRLLNCIIKAARRGVDVRLILPGISDVPAAHYAGRAFYTGLLRNGVRIFHYEGAVLHAKSYVFDGLFSIVGSANLDAQSLRWNDEGNVGIWSEDFGFYMKNLFEDDLKRSNEIFLDEWFGRPLCDRIKEKFFAMFRARL
ncbi:MAG: phospholipase D-like domain-containing protein [Thermodesulfovibrionales bacterium]